MRLLLQLMVARVSLSEEGDLPSDAAIFTWASVSPKVAQRVNQVERKRIHLLKTIIGRSPHVELLYLVWVGFVARGQRDPDSRKQFPQVARMMLNLFPPRKPRRDKRVTTKA